MTDILIGTDGNDDLIGQDPQSNTVKGGKGDDTLRGKGVINILDGGEGHDIFIIDSGYTKVKDSYRAKISPLFNQGVYDPFPNTYIIYKEDSFDIQNASSKDIFVLSSTIYDAVNPGLAADKTGLNFKEDLQLDDWGLRVGADPKKDINYIFTESRSKDGKYFLDMGLFYADMVKDWVVVYRFNPSADEDKGVEITFPDGVKGTLPIPTSNDQFCQAEVSKNSKSFIDYLKNNPEGTLTFVDKESGPITIPFSLKGFNKAFDGLQKMHKLTNAKAFTITPHVGMNDWFNITYQNDGKKFMIDYHVEGTSGQSVLGKISTITINGQVYPALDPNRAGLVFAKEGSQESFKLYLTENIIPYDGIIPTLSGKVITVKADFYDVAKDIFVTNVKGEAQVGLDVVHGSPIYLKEGSGFLKDVYVLYEKIDGGPVQQCVGLDLKNGDVQKFGWDSSAIENFTRVVWSGKGPTSSLANLTNSTTIKLAFGFVDTDGKHRVTSFSRESVTLRFK